MTAPTGGTTGGSTPPDRPGNRKLKTVTLALIAATATIVALHSGGSSATPTPSGTVDSTATIPGPTVGLDTACASGTQLLAMRAADTARMTVVGDTVYVQRVDTLLRVDESTHQGFQIAIAAGDTVQLAARCVPVSPTFRVRIVAALPSAG